jgi:hypothetical protein
MPADRPITWRSYPARGSASAVAKPNAANVQSILYALALLCASIASASAANITMGPEFHPPKGYVIPTDEQLARTPGKYRGKIVVTGGKVSQVLPNPDDDTQVILMVQSETDPFGANSTTMVVYKHFDPDNRILEGDRVILWGSYEGLRSYDTVLHAQRTVPCIVAEQVMLVPKGQ